MKKPLFLCIPLLFSDCNPDPVSPLIDYEIYNTISIKNSVYAIQDGFHRNYRFVTLERGYGGRTYEYNVSTTGDTLFTTEIYRRHSNFTNGFTYPIKFQLSYPLFPSPYPPGYLAMATPGCIDIEIRTYLNDSLFDSQIFQMGFSSWNGIDSSFNAETACDLVGAFEKIIYFPYL